MNFKRGILHNCKVFLKTIKPRKQSKEVFYVAAALNPSVILRYCSSTL